MEVLFDGARGTPGPGRLVLLIDLVETSRAVASTRSRSAKIAAIAARLREAPPEELSLAVTYLSGDLRQRRSGLGWASLRDLPDPSPVPSLQLTEVDEALDQAEKATGPGSVTRRRTELVSIMRRATGDEQEFIAALIGGELRQGALAGIMTEAVAQAAGVDVAGVRRAAMLAGDLAAVASVALSPGKEGLDRFRLQVGRPVQPMLAQSASTIGEALQRTDGRAGIEWKLDGVRIQVHRHRSDVSVYSRSLDAITNQVPEVVEAVRGLPLDSVILDGEVIALDSEGRPRPFQETGGRVATRSDANVTRSNVRLTAFFFDILHLDGIDLLDLPQSRRQRAAERVIPAGLWVPRIETDEAVQAQSFMDGALARGHEGVVIKDPSAPYEAGRRGGSWIKVKPRHTLDLVILAAEWGHGRRQGFLSNLHLGARDPETGGLVMLGKTFKGLTDEMLRWQTARLLELETSRDSSTVYVRPELVAEIAFDGVQTSSRYPGGMALRFARVLKYRTDKRVDEADTVEEVRRLQRL
jgi:DNA ligase 1